MARRIWLLSVELAGRTIRCATDPCAPVALVAGEAYTAGELITHEPTLDFPTVSWRAIPGESCVGDFSADVSFFLPSDLSLCAIWAKGQPLHRGVAELAVWYEGASYESRSVLAKGYIEIEDFALFGEKVSASILAPSPDATDVIPGTNDVISDATLDPYIITASGVSIGFNMPDDVAGAPYPLPLGRPGLYIDATGASTDVPASPALLITQSAGVERVLVAGRPVGATTLTIFNADAEGIAVTTYSGTVTTIQDQNGVILSSVLVTSVGSWKFDGTETFYCAGWSDAITFDNGEHIRGLGDACLYMLRLARSGAVFDLGRWVEAQAALNTIAIGGYIDTPVDPWKVITEQLLCVFPRCVVLNGPSGLYPAVFEVVPPDQCIELVEGRDFDLLDNVRPEYATSAVYSAVRVEYALNTATQNYLGMCVMGPRVDDITESGHEAATRSYSWSVGANDGPTRETMIVQTAWVWEHDSAARAADDWVQLSAERLPSVRVALLDAVRWRSLPIGLAVRLTSTTLGWTEVPMWVCGLTMSALDEVELLARPRT